MLESVLDPLDLHALTFAKRITDADPAAKTVYLTMGPPQARDVLVDCLSRAPGEAILLTDRVDGRRRHVGDRLLAGHAPSGASSGSSSTAAATTSS